MLSQPPPSFFQLDTEGRVIRTDSFSKMLSSGLPITPPDETETEGGAVIRFRLGFVTGPNAVIERLMLHLQVTSMHASSLSQVTNLLFVILIPHPRVVVQAVVRELLSRWGIQGFLAHSKE